MRFDKDKIPLYKKAMSFASPVWLWSEKSVLNKQLDVLFYKGRFQLATSDALYSDGFKYTPALAIVRSLKKFLPTVKKTLICGVGLGSTVEIMDSLGWHPDFTLVEYDKTILRLATEYLSTFPKVKFEPVWENAQTFMEKTTSKWNFIFIDIFDSRVVPEFVTGADFLNHCKNALEEGGKLAMNYIINNEANWEETQARFKEIFPDHYVISDDINRIFIASK